MELDLSLINYFWQASLVVKCVMVLLIAASLFSWTFILQNIFYLKYIKSNTRKFEKHFWSEDITQLFAKIAAHSTNLYGLHAIFYAGFKEYARLRKQGNVQVNMVVENAKRAMRAAQIRTQADLETHLSFLAIVGSVSPYIGLFGTVWGIMQAFRALANVQQATIAMVAPGIAEALIATALGLFAAIPAVIAYNRFVTNISQLINRFDAFQEEFINVLVRQLEAHPMHSKVTATIEE